MTRRVLRTASIAAVLGAAGAYAAVFAPAETDAAIRNPHMGWVYIVNAYPHFTDEGRSIPFLNDGTAWGRVDAVAVLSDWAALEPSEGTYDWPHLDRAIASWTSKGKKIHLRIATDAMITNGRMDGTGGAPAWLYGLGVGKMYREEWGRSIPFPDYTHPAYLPKLRAFLRALASHVRPFDSIEAADLRGYGMWGEWHSGHDMQDMDTRMRTLRAIIDAWSEAFANQPQPFHLYLSTSWEYRDDLIPKGLASRGDPPPTYAQYVTGSAFDYGFSLPRVAPRRDGVAGFIYPNLDGRLMHDLWKSQRKPFIAELGGAAAVFENGERWGYGLQSAIDEALQYHANYIMVCNWDIGLAGSVEDLSNAPPIQFYNTHGALMDATLREMGYRLVPVRIEAPDRIVPGQPFHVLHTWENRAQGRLPYPYRFAIALEREGAVRWQGVDPIFDPTNIVRGETYRWVSAFNLPDHGLDSGGYTVRVSLVNDAGTQRIALPIGDDNDRTYRIGEVRVAPQADTRDPLSFETFEDEGAPAYRIDDAHGQRIGNTAHVIRGARSVKGANKGEQEWSEFLRSNPSSLPLEPNGIYTVSFLYRPLEAHGGTLEDPGFFYFLARSDTGGISEDRGFTRWQDQPGAGAAAKTVIVALGPHGDYRLMWGVCRMGAAAIDDICVTRVPSENALCVAVSPTEANGFKTASQEVAFDPATRQPRSSEILAADPARVRLSPNTSYTVCFDYESRADPQFGSHAWLKLRSRNGNGLPDRTLLTWAQRAGSRETKYVTFTTGPSEAGTLVWGFANGGSCRIDRVTIFSNATRG